MGKEEFARCAGRTRRIERGDANIMTHRRNCAGEYL